MNTTQSALIKQGHKAKMPDALSPMLCTLVKDVPDSDEWLYEIKWDGYRIISYGNKGKIRMDSRSALDYTKKYPPVAAALKDLKHDFVMDGEVVVFNEQGHPDFDALQKYNGHDTPISYCVFDLLWLDGYDLMGLPLKTRKLILEALLKGNQILKYSVSYTDGPALYQKMLELELEGVVAKRQDSAYVPGQRAGNWLKIPTHKRQEFVIGGWAESDKSRAFRSLLFGAYRGKELEWIGRSGGGYKEKEMPGILKQLKSLEITESPFVNQVLDTKGAKLHWVKPDLVANFEFAAWTTSGRIRKPATFLGFRKDKKARQVVREVPKDDGQTKSSQVEAGDDVPKQGAAQGKDGKKTRLKKSSSLPLSEESNWRKIDIPAQSEEIKIGDCTINIYEVEREIWKGVPKAALIQYYHSIAPFILPYLRDRPQSLHVKLVNAGAPGLYIKDMEGRQPACADIFSDKRKHKKSGKRDVIDYLVCNNEATLLWMINLGCVDINPWNSRVAAPDQPDFVVIDLDPTDDDFKKVIETAKAAKKVLDKLKIKSFVKTSGKTGMHILLPCTGINSATARNMAEVICGMVHEVVPEISTVSVGISSRGDKVFVDFSQNDYADTIAAPYSARPGHTPTVSTPIDWKELNAKLHPSNFTIDNILARIKKKGDLFKNLLDKKTAAANTKRLKTII